MMNKKTGKIIKKGMIAGLLCFFISVSMACSQSLSNSNIYEEIRQYEWTDLYEHENSYEDAAETIFILLPMRLFNGQFATSLIIEDKKEFDIFGELLEKCFIPHYGGIYENGIPVKNHESYEACYAATITLLKTLHKEYIEMGIIEKKE